MHELNVSTSKALQIVDITASVEALLKSVKSGICLVYVPHATASVIVNEYEPHLEKDFIRFFSEFVPKGDYEHNEIDDNAEAHMKSAFFGPGACVPVEGGRLALGTWQRILLCEFDGPRSRKVYVQVTDSQARP